MHKQQGAFNAALASGCDLLKISYLCRCINNFSDMGKDEQVVVICLKFLTFVGA